MKTLSLRGEVVAQFLSDFDEVVVRLGVFRFQRNKANVNADNIAANRLGEVGDFLDFFKSSGARLRGNQTDGLFGRRDVRVGFAFKTAEDNQRGQAEFLQTGFERSRLFGRARLFGRRMHLDVLQTNLLGEVNLNAQPGVDADERGNRELLFFAAFFIREARSAQNQSG